MRGREGFVARQESDPDSRGRAVRLCWEGAQEGSRGAGEEESRGLAAGASLGVWKLLCPKIENNHQCV